MSEYAIVIWPTDISKKVFTEIALSIQYRIIKSGYVCYIYKDTNLVESDDVTYIILGANACINVEMKIPKNSIVVNFEQLFENASWATGPYMKILKENQVWDYDIDNVKWLRNKGCNNIKTLTYGFSPTMIYDENIDGKEDIDVLFFGSITQRRWKILKYLKNALPPHLNFQHIYGIWGKHRDDIVRRSKIIINIHAFENHSRFEMTRISYLLSNKKAVISEPSDVEGSWKNIIDFVDYKNMPTLIMDRLRDVVSLKKRGDEGFKFIKNIPVQIPLVPLNAKHLESKLINSTYGSENNRITIIDKINKKLKDANFDLSLLLVNLLNIAPNTEFGDVAVNKPKTLTLIMDSGHTIKLHEFNNKLVRFDISRQTY